MNVLNRAKEEIKELVALAKCIERFDCEIICPAGVTPTDAALERRKKCEERYVTLLNRYV